MESSVYVSNQTVALHPSERLALALLGSGIASSIRRGGSQMYPFEQRGLTSNRRGLGFESPSSRKCFGTQPSGLVFLFCFFRYSISSYRDAGISFAAGRSTRAVSTIIRACLFYTHQIHGSSAVVGKDKSKDGGVVLRNDAFQVNALQFFCSRSPLNFSARPSWSTDLKTY